jgi:signal recognition particle receptor subunit beta
VVLFNYTTMQLTAKIVYYGPGLGGKTTNLAWIHQKTAPGTRGEMVSLETETDRTLFFDLLPIDVGVIGGMKVRLQLYTVPGQVFYNATRKLVLKGVDGIVFVADSQLAALEANVESLNNLKTNLGELGLALEQVPAVFQYNKRDIRNIHSVDTMNSALNAVGAPYFEAAALHGIGVFETLKCISKLSIGIVRKKLAADDPRRKPDAAAAPTSAASAAPPVAGPRIAGPPAAGASIAGPAQLDPLPFAPAPAASAKPIYTPAEADSLLASLVPDRPRGDEVPVEFAEEDTGKHIVRAVKTKGQVDIQRELEGLRSIAAASRSPGAGNASAKALERRLQDILVLDQDQRQELKRKASLEVPSHLLRSTGSLRVHLAFDGDDGEQVVHDAVSVKLVGNRRLERLTLHIDLEIKGKSS